MTANILSLFIFLFFLGYETNESNLSTIAIFDKRNIINLDINKSDEKNSHNNDNDKRNSDINSDNNNSKNGIMNDKDSKNDKKNNSESNTDNENIENNNNNKGNENNENENVLELGLEYRVICNILPLRVYLDNYFIHFIKDLISNYEVILHEKNVRQNLLESESNNNISNNNSNNNSTDVCTYFQHVRFAPLHLKIDFEPGKEVDNISVMHIYAMYGVL